MNVRSLSSIAIALSLAGTAVACDPVMLGAGFAAVSSIGDDDHDEYGNGYYTDPEAYDDSGYYGEGSYDYHDPAMVHFDDALSSTLIGGKLGGYETSTDDVTSATAYRYEGQSAETVTLLARGLTAMMLQVTIGGGIDELPMGPSEGLPYDAIGCAGQNPAYWDVDVDSDAVRFDRRPTDDPDVDTITVEADFDGDTLVGSFDYDRTLR